MHPVFAEIQTALDQHHLLPPGCRCVVAASGGLDSMVLLHAMAHRRTDPGSGAGVSSPLVVAHFHHQLRGHDADLDQESVARAAARLGLPFVSDTAPVDREMTPGESIESCARRLRHQFLARVARETGCPRIATGHHAGDQVELFLMRLLRGAGGHGLGGMRPQDPSPADPALTLIRPLLGCERADLAAAAADAGIEWREDASNQDSRFVRNRIRNQLIPRLTQDFQPALRAVLRRTQTVIRDQADLVESLALAWLRGTGSEAFGSLPIAVQREALRIQLESGNLPGSFDLIERLRLEPESPFAIDTHRMVQRNATGRIQVTSRPPTNAAFGNSESFVDLSGPSGEVDFGGVHIAWQWEEIPGEARPHAHASPDEGGCEWMDGDAVGLVLRLRHWQPGDRYQPMGLPAASKLQDLFTNARIPAEIRRQAVLAVNADGRLLWTEGLRLSEQARLTPSTRRRLRWHWRRTGTAKGATDSDGNSAHEPPVVS